MLKTIKLYGVLRKKFGRIYRLDVSSTREAMRALSAQVQGFEAFMMNAHTQGLRFAVWQDKRNVTERDLELETDADIIRIAPIAEGAGGRSGVLSLVLGAVLIGVGAFAFGTTTAMGAALIGAGVGMAVGGIAQMLMPKIDAMDKNNDGNRANKGFGGAVTTVAQGNPVPILYGQREIGGFIASAGQYPEDVK